MSIEGRGRIAVWEGASLWVLAAARETGGTDYHAHHAIQVTLSLAGDFELRTEHERLTGPAVAVASDARHVFRASGIGAFRKAGPAAPSPPRPFAARHSPPFPSPGWPRRWRRSPPGSAPTAARPR